MDITDITGRGTVWSQKKLLIQWPIEIVDLSIKNWTIFQFVIYIKVYQRVS